MKFVATEIASMLQNTGSKHTITQTDIGNAFRAAYLSIFPGISMYATDNGGSYFPLGYFPHVWIHYIDCEGDKSTLEWSNFLWTANPAYKGFSRSQRVGVQSPESIIKCVSKGNASAIHPDLKMSDGEVKIIIECSVWYTQNRFFSGSNISCSKVPVKDAFGFYIISPAPQGIQSNKASYFSEIVILSPVPNAFKKTIPAQ